MVSLTADVNWLLSAIAQASAALVAIVGGLLVTRYVTLHAEQQAAQRRLDDLNRRHNEARTRLDDLEHEWGELSARSFFDQEDVLEGIFHGLAQADLTLDAVLIHVATEDDFHDRDVYERHFNDTVQEFLRARSELEPRLQIELYAESWTEFKKGKRFPVEREAVWEWVYERTAQQRSEMAREQHRRTHELRQSREPFSTGVYFEPIDRELSLRGGQHTERLNLLASWTDDAREEMRALKQEQRLAGETLQATLQPEGFSLALQVLSVLSLFGMGIPVAIMAVLPATSMVWWGRSAVAVIFFVGVAVLLRFLFTYASYLRGETPALPRTVWGLVSSRRKRQRDRAAPSEKVRQED